MTYYYLYIFQLVVEIQKSIGYDCHVGLDAFKWDETTCGGHINGKLNNNNDNINNNIINNMIVETIME